MDAKEWRKGDIVSCGADYLCEIIEVNEKGEVNTRVLYVRGQPFKGDDCEVGFTAARAYDFVRRPTSESEPVQPAPVIEEKPYCHCCTVNMFPSADVEGFTEIRHDDPCQFTHLERLMLSKAKAMFRERQKAQQIQDCEEGIRKMDLSTMADIENDRGGRFMTPSLQATYEKLTGHVFHFDD